jgi:hypothetical protein
VWAVPTRPAVESNALIIIKFSSQTAQSTVYGPRIVYFYNINVAIGPSKFFILVIRAFEKVINANRPCCRTSRQEFW